MCVSETIGHTMMPVSSLYVIDVIINLFIQTSCGSLNISQATWTNQEICDILRGTGNTFFLFYIPFHLMM